MCCMLVVSDLAYIFGYLGGGGGVWNGCSGDRCRVDQIERY